MMRELEAAVVDLESELEMAEAERKAAIEQSKDVPAGRDFVPAYVVRR